MSLISPTEGYPLERIEGDPGAMSDAHEALVDAGEGLSGLSTAATQAQDLPGQGESITAARGDADDLITAVDPAIDEARLLARVLLDYSDAYETYAEHANAMIPDIEEAHAQWQSLSTAAQEAGRAALDAAEGDDQAAAEQAMQASDEACAARDRAKAELDALWQDFERYYGQWDDAYDDALVRLATSTGKDLSPEARDLLADLLSADSPAEVAEIWREADAHERRKLRHSRADIIGNLHGVPYDVRAAVNKHHLKSLLASGDIPDGKRAELQALAQELKTGPPPPQLVSFDVDGAEQVTAAFAYGDLDDASHINVLVPGMKSNVKGMPSWGTSARDINAEVPGDTATIVWFGYDSPGYLEETMMGRAADGAASLSGLLGGIGSLEPGAQTSVVAHSYGSTTAALAIGSEPGGLGVDKFITVGSAGFPEDKDVLANLQTGPQVYSTRSPADLWAPVGSNTSFGHGVVPSDLSFVHEFGSDGGVSADGDDLALTPGHSAHTGGNGMPWDDGETPGYLMEGSESFYNVKHIIATGEPGTQLDGPGSRNLVQNPLVREILQEGSSLSNKAGDVLETGASNAGETVADAGDWVGGKISASSDEAGTVASSAVDAALGAAGVPDLGFSDTAGELTSQAVEGAGEAVSEGAELAGDGISELGEWADEHIFDWEVP